jgi:signal transduction histidine kinase
MNNPDVYLSAFNVVLLLALSGAVMAWRRAGREVVQSTRLRLMMEQAYRDRLRRAEEEVVRSRRARATFLAAANHDLRQPLQAMTCFSAVLAQRLRGRSKLAAVSLQQSLDVLNTHIETLVDLSRLEAGILEPQIGAVAAGPLLDDIAGEFAPLAAAKGLRLTVVRSRVTVVSDPDMLRRALDNLVGNAVRFTERGGIVVGCRRRGDRVRFEVWDSGIGIAEDQLESVFEEFYQVGNPQRDRTNGLGLGLAVVERLVRLLPGHRVAAVSRLGVGSRFTIEAPIRPPYRPGAPSDQFLGTPEDGIVHSARALE